MKLLLLISLGTFFGFIRAWVNGEIDPILWFTTRKQKKELAKIQQEQKEKEEQLAKDRKWFYNKVWNANWENKGEKIDIRDIPQLSFEQWLTFYNSAPERWEINLRQCDYACTQFCAIPTYKKGKVYIDTFWDTPEDLGKFMDWQENEYKAGDVAIFEQERARRLSKLAKCLKEDIAERAKITQKELEALEKEVANSMPTKKPTESSIERICRIQRELKNGIIFSEAPLKTTTSMTSEGKIVIVDEFIYHDEISNTSYYVNKITEKTLTGAIISENWELKNQV